MTLEDKVKASMYIEFHRHHEELYKKDITQYWRECEDYMRRNYSKRLESEKQKFRKSDV